MSSKKPVSWQNWNKEQTLNINFENGKNLFLFTYNYKAYFFLNQTFFFLLHANKSCFAHSFLFFSFNLRFPFVYSFLNKLLRSVFFNHFHHHYQRNSFLCVFLKDVLSLLMHKYNPKEFLYSILCVFFY